MDDRTDGPPTERAELPKGRAQRSSEDAHTPPRGAKLHMTGRGLSPAAYLAQHGAHDHQADFSDDGGLGGPERQDETPGRSSSDRKR